MDSEATIATLYNPLKNEAILGHAEFQIWDELYATHPDRVAIMNATAGGFFSMLSPMLTDNVMMRLSRLTDPPGSGKHRNLTLRLLIPLLKEDSAAVGTFSNKLNALDAACEAMRNQRNKRMAHLDLETATLDGADLPGVRVADIRSCLVHLQEAMNIFERECGLPIVMYADFIHHAGPLALLGALKRTIAYRKHVEHGTIDPRKDSLELPHRASKDDPK
jgi:hypothetical protein